MASPPASAGHVGLGLRAACEPCGGFRRIQGRSGLGEEQTPARQPLLVPPAPFSRKRRAAEGLCNCWWAQQMVRHQTWL